MKCEDIEQKMLLAESGELPAADARELEAHLASCAKCRQYRNSLRKITDLARNAYPVQEPSGRTVAAIISEAAREASPISFRRPIITVLAYAAALIIVAGVWIYYRPANGNGRSDRINQTCAAMAMVSGAEYKNGHSISEADQEAALKALSVQLLKMQGFYDEPVDTDS